MTLFFRSGVVFLLSVLIGPGPLAGWAQKPAHATDADPADQLMQDVIRYKKQWRSDLDTYQAKMASRFVLVRDTGIVFAEETASSVFWRRGRGPWQVVAARQRTTEASGYRLAAPSYGLNLYDDEIRIKGFRLMGPTHPQALKRYRFRRVGRTRSPDGTLLHKVKMTPISRLQPAFAGTLWVQKDPAVLRKVKLHLSQGVRFSPPVQEGQATYRQRFERVADRFWLPVNLRIRERLDVGVPTIQYPTFRSRQRVRFHDYQTNVSLPDSIFERKTRRRVVDRRSVSDARRLQEVLPRTPCEQRAFAQIDSARSLNDVLRPHGFGTLLGPLSWWLFDLDVDFKPERSAATRPRNDMQLIRPQVWYDRVDGFHLGLAPRLRLGGRFQLKVDGGYKTNLKQGFYGGEATVDVGPNRQLTLGASFRDGIDRRYGRNWSGARFANGLDMLLGDQDYFDYFDNRRLRGWVQYHWRPAHLRLGVRFADERHRSVATDSSDIMGFDVRAGLTNNILTEILFGGDHEQRLNPSIHDGNLRSLRVQLAWRDGQRALGIRGRRGVRLTAETSAGALGSDFTFTRWEAEANWRFNTFLARRRQPMTLDVYATVGTSTGALPPQRIGTLSSNLSPYPDLGIFRTLGRRPYEGDHWVGVFWMHDFRTVPFELLGLNWLVQRGLSLIVYGAHGRTWMNTKHRQTFKRVTGGLSPFLPDGFHNEVGLSLNGVLGLVHLDLTARLDKFKLHPGLGLARVF